MATADERRPADTVWTEVTASSDAERATVNIRDRHEIELDEPPWVPYGDDQGPCPGDLLVSAMAGCQVEVLKQCFEKARVEEYDLSLYAERERERGGEGPGPFPDHTSNRYTLVRMELTVTTTPEYEDRVARCLDVCEDACIISQSVAGGIPVELTKALEVTEVE